MYAKPGRFLKYKILHIDDSPHRIAMGVGLGLFIAWSPFLGLHILIALALAFLLRANKFAAITFVWVCNPLTFAAIYYPTYLVGKTVIGWVRAGSDLSAEQATMLFKDFFSISHITANFYTGAFWREFGSLFFQTGIELIAGWVIIGSLIAAASYFATVNIIKWHRRGHRRFKDLQ